MFRASITLINDENEKQMFRSDGFCFRSDEDAFEWADEYAQDLVMQASEAGFDACTYIIHTEEQI